MTTSAAAHPRFAEALTALGLQVPVRAFPDATRTAAQAATAVGCELGQIVKSLIFTADGVPVLVLMDGASRVDVERVRAHLGATEVRRADADLVRETTGYAIGGVPPSGTGRGPPSSPTGDCWPTPPCGRPLGTPHTVFPMAPAELVEHAGAALADVRERTA